LFALGQEREEIRRDADPIQLAEILIAVFHLTTINWLTGWWGGRRPSLQRRVAVATETFLEGCAVR
jgi:hypothetical protein